MDTVCDNCKKDGKRFKSRHDKMGHILKKKKKRKKKKETLHLFIYLHISANTYPNGYIVPAEFGVHFLPRMKNIPKQTKLHLNGIGLTNIEFCKRQI